MDAGKTEDFQLPNLETFSKAAELSSFTGAAKALCLTQSAVSQRVQALEKSLGTSLFKRQGGRVLLTKSGQRLHEYAQRILGLHREARREITGHEIPLAGELLLAASSIPGEHLLPSLLAAFGENHPHIRVVRTSVTDKATENLVRKLVADPKYTKDKERIEAFMAHKDGGCRRTWFYLKRKLGL